MLMNRVKRGIAQDVTADFRSFEGINPELGSMDVAGDSSADRRSSRQSLAADAAAISLGCEPLIRCG